MKYWGLNPNGFRGFFYTKQNECEIEIDRENVSENQLFRNGSLSGQRFKGKQNAPPFPPPKGEFLDSSTSLYKR